MNVSSISNKSYIREDSDGYIDRAFEPIGKQSKKVVKVVTKQRTAFESKIKEMRAKNLGIDSN
jgi:hypothetical protein